MIINLDKVQVKDINSVGGKAANLGELIKIGMNVPKGFVVLPETDLQKDEKRIYKEYDNLRLNRVSVRSSATAEDSKDASFAGQFNTFLNVNKDELIERIKKCRNSIANSRVVAYCKANKIDPKDVRVAVIVQEMINSDVSGVGFSLNPVTGNKNEIIIEVVLGLGEMIVSGKVTPDTYTVSKPQAKIVSRTIGKQRIMGVVKKGGDTDQKQVSKHLQNKQKIADSKVITIAKTVLEIEDHYSYPVDVEWTYERDELYILQARPVTGRKHHQSQCSSDRLFINIHGYQKLFEVEGPASFLGSDLFMGYYKKLDALLLFSNKLWISYLPNRIIRNTCEEGLKLYSQKDAIQKYRASFTSHVKNSKEYFEEVLDDGKVRKGTTQRFLELISKTYFFYSKTEFFYTELIFKDPKKRKRFESSFPDFGEFKNKKRSFLNEVYADDSYYDRLLEKISESFNIPTKDLNLYSISEVIDLFDGTKLSEKTLRERKVAYISGSNNGKVTNTYGKRAKIAIAEMRERANEEASVLKGQVASSGKVRGEVKVLKFGFANTKEIATLIKSMKKGQILVADTTGPELISACRKAKAIITNQGGMLSHAAIISRELNIPCIVGTGDATSVLKDGDYVEVDADKGTVSKLKQQ
ncbi:MAG: PEP/pyruvate-binding domain-containing protein [Patescibacteria group bacterium]|nr:hypothetical protein [Patescibacteria group bacterium]